MEGKEAVISFRKADIAGGDSIVIYGLDMDVYPGDFMYIVGKVGTGKTSIIRTAIAENRLVSGKGRVCGYELDGIKEKDIPFLRRKLGVVFQDFQLLMDRSVEENLRFVLKATGWKDAHEIDRRIAEVLNSVGMKNKAHKMPHQLSGGEQQRVAIARALLNRPEVIIADEPTGNLDPETAESIMQLLTRINMENGTAIVMVTHNLTLVDRYPGRVMVCADETCVEKTIYPDKADVAETSLSDNIGEDTLCPDEGSDNSQDNSQDNSTDNGSDNSQDNSADKEKEEA